jgi:hypothetical protein
MTIPYICISCFDHVYLPCLPILTSLPFLQLPFPNSPSSTFRFIFVFISVEFSFHTWDKMNYTCLSVSGLFCFKCYLYISIHIPASYTLSLFFMANPPLCIYNMFFKPFICFQSHRLIPKPFLLWIVSH